MNTSFDEFRFKPGKKVMISGCNGQLMTDIILKIHEHNVIAQAAATGCDIASSDIKTFLSAKEGFINLYKYNRQQWDITDSTKSEELFEKYEPTIYINGASIHSVDDIESDPTRAFEVNVGAISNLVKLCNKFGTTFINISTNYVFGGEDAIAYNESHQPNPINMYGIMKYAGEQVVKNDCDNFINIRVAGLFGKTGSRAKGNSNFPLMILKNLKNSNHLKVVNDQTMNIGYTVDIAIALVNMFADSRNPELKNKTYHLVNEGMLTWYDLAKFIIELKGLNPDKILTSIVSDQRYDGAKRPKFSALLNTKLRKLPTWESAIVRFLREIDEL